VNLFIPSEGSVGWADLGVGVFGSINQNFRDIQNAINSGNIGFPKGYLSPGLILAWLSSTTFSVSAGAARDQTNAKDMTLGSPVTVDVTKLNTALGVDATLIGTLNFHSSSRLVDSGTGTFATYFAPGKSPPNLSGTVTASGTTITGTSTKFTTELKIHDLVGNNTYGWSRVTAIASDTSLTISISLGTVPSQTFNKQECSLLSSPTRTYRVDNISAGGSSLQTVELLSDSGTWTAYAGGRRTWMTSTGGCWYSVWLVTDGTTVTAILSGSRSAPMGNSGYTTAYRRIGWVLLDTSGNVQAFSESADRIFTWEVDRTTVRAVSAVTPTANTWTKADLSSLIPPTASRATLSAFNGGTSTTPTTFYRPSGVGSSTVGRPTYIVHYGSGSAATSGTIETQVSVLQAIDWASTTAVPITVDVAGWHDDWSLPPLS
jgi:hypothetical protein